MPNADEKLKAKTELEKGIEISTDTIAQLQKLMNKIIAYEKDDEIKWYSSNENNLVFGLKSTPNLVFKMAHPNTHIVTLKGSISPPERVTRRFENMITAKAICMIHQLERLLIPHAKKFKVLGHTLIAEEFMDICSNPSAQKELYRTLEDEVVRQQAVFIIHTDFSDVAERNMPMVGKNVAFVDLEEMRGAKIGIFGDALIERRGLIGCLHSEHQIDVVLEEAELYGISDQVKAMKAKTARLEEIELNRQLQDFYEKNGILANPRKLIQIDDLTTLGLNLEEKGYLTSTKYRQNGSDGGEDWVEVKTPITLGKVVVNVIAQINEAITKAEESASTQGKRSILLHPGSQKLKGCERIGLPDKDRYITKEVEEKLWIKRILDALVDKGHLFKLVQVNPPEYVIQA